jgi:hypothetical protein
MDAMTATVPLRCAGLAIATAVVLVAGSVAPASAANPATALRAKAGQPNQAAIAKRLATRYAKARTERARYRALVAIARKLRVGVYTPRGRAVVRMRARKGIDPEFYDFELRLLASHPDERSSLDDLAGTVNRATGTRKPLTTARLAGALASRTQRARRRPRNRFSLPMLLARELGLRQQPRADTARRASARAIQLSRVQRWLVLTEIVTGQARDIASRPRAGQAQIDLPPSAEPPGNRDELEDVCGISARGRQWSSFGQTLGGVVSDTVNGIQVVVSALHSTFLEDLIVVTSDAWRTNGHHGPAEHAIGQGSGNQFTFVINVAARYSESIKEVEQLVKCGPLYGIQMPPPGRLPNVPVRWEASAGYATLLEHGQVTYQDKVTGNDGSARLSVRLDDEVVPGIGEERQVEATLSPAVDFRSLFNPLSGFVRELGFAADVEFPFSIKWHDARGLKFKAAFTWRTWEYILSNGGPPVPPQPLGTLHRRVFLRNCNRDNPWDTPWSFAAQFYNEVADPAEDEYHPVMLESHPLKPPTVIHYWTFQILPTSPPTVRITDRSTDDLVTNGSSPYPAGGPQYSQTVTVPIEEDTSCPD